MVKSDKGSILFRLSQSVTQLLEEHEMDERIDPLSDFPMGMKNNFKTNLYYVISQTSSALPLRSLTTAKVVLRLGYTSDFFRDVFPISPFLFGCRLGS